MCGPNFSVVTWWLVDANANVRLVPIEDDSVLSLSSLENEYNTFSFSIEVETDPPVVGSVAFTDNLGVGVELQNSPPYALGGASGDDYLSLSFDPADWTVTAQPFCQSGAEGGSGAISTISFLLVA